MKHRKLLQDGTKVSEIGLGCMSFAGFYGPTTEAQAHKTLAAALDMGVTFLDTANIYGMGVSESVIGSFLKGDNTKFVIATKAAVWDNPETGKRGFNNTRDHLRAELELSLARLQLERVALYYIHRRALKIEIEQVMEILLSLRSKAKSVVLAFLKSRLPRCDVPVRSARWMRCKANIRFGRVIQI